MNTTLTTNSSAALVESLVTRYVGIMLANVKPAYECVSYGEDSERLNVFTTRKIADMYYANTYEVGCDCTCSSVKEVFVIDSTVAQDEEELAAFLVHAERNQRLQLSCVAPAFKNHSHSAAYYVYDLLVIEAIAREAAQSIAHNLELMYYDFVSADHDSISFNTVYSENVTTISYSELFNLV